MYVFQNQMEGRFFKMKRNCILMFIIILFFCFISSGLYAQSSNCERRIIGTWICINEPDYTWVFSADGKLAYNKPDGSNSGTYSYSVIDTKLVIMVESNVQIYDIYLSSDGTKLLLIGGLNVNGWSRGGPGYYRNYLTKK